ncbi:MAG: hypothetical protein JJD96_07130, partial [Thermoleophilia bacterium]|nr:hypothetical protein [Thermoleophilia bacterium]
MKDKTPDDAAKFNSCDDGAAVNGSGDISTAVKGRGNLLGDITERIRSAQYAALRAVKRDLIGLYWDIGRMIVERQARE